MPKKKSTKKKKRRPIGERGSFSIVPVGGSGGGGGGGGNSFTTIQPDSGGNVVADGTTDTLTLTGTQIGIAGTPGTDTLTFSIAAGAVTNTEVSASAAIAYSKLNLATSIVNADIGAAAAIAYSKLNLGTSIVNADIAAGAVIAFSKLAALASGNILVGSAGTVPTSVAMSGDATLVASGALTLSNSAVTGQVLTSLAAGTGAIAAADTILAAMGKAVASNSSSVTASTIAIYSGTGGHLVTPSTITASGTTLNMSNGGQIQFGTSNCTITNSAATLQIFFSGSGTQSATFDAAGLTIAQASSSSVALNMGGTTALGSTTTIKGPNSSGATSTNAFTIQPGAMTGTSAVPPGSMSVLGGGTTSSNSSSIPSALNLTGGITTNASNTAKGGDVIMGGGTTAGSGNGGDSIMRPGTSASGQNGACILEGRISMIGIQRETSSTTVTVLNTTSVVIVDYGSLQATATFTLPASTVLKNGQAIKFGSGTNGVTAFTLTAGSGTSVTGALTTLTVGQTAEYIYVTASTTWYRVS